MGTFGWIAREDIEGSHCQADILHEVADGKAVKFAFQCIEPFHRRVLSFPGSGLEENGGNPTDIIQHYARVYNGFHK